MEEQARAAVAEKKHRARKGSGSVYQPTFKTKDGQERVGNWRVRFTWTDALGVKHTFDEKVPGVKVNSSVAGEYLKEKMAEAKKGKLTTATEAENLTYPICARR